MSEDYKIIKLPDKKSGIKFSHNIFTDLYNKQ